jgi:hypothetical protein
LGRPASIGRLSDRDVLQRLAEVGFRCCRESVGAVAQVDLVQVDLEDLVLGQQMLQLECQQYLVDLARQRFFGAEIDISRDLHRYRRGALALDAIQVCETGAHHSLVVDAAVRIKARVLGGEHCIFHNLGDGRNGCQIAALFAEFADQNSFRRKNAQRQFRPVVRKFRDIRQIGISDRQRDRNNEQHRDHGSRHNAACPQHDAQEPAEPGRAFLVRERRLGLPGWARIDGHGSKRSRHSL